MEVGAGLFADFFSREAAQISKSARSFDDKGRFIAFATVGNGSEERAVGLNEDAIQRNVHGGVSDLLCLGKRDIPRERDHETHIEGALGVGPSSSETMQNTPQSVRCPLLLNQGEALIPCVFGSVGRAAMNNDG